jgi:hypothetical protein
MLKKIIIFFIHLVVAAVGIVFLYSAYTKLDPVIETFEMSFIKLGVANWTTAPWIARLMIGIEIFIGLLLVLNYHLKFTLKAGITLLMVFNTYLLYQIVSGSGSDNCGCFGEVIHMTPAQALGKNAVMIFALLPGLLFRLEGWKFKKHAWVLWLSVGTVSSFLPHALNPVFYDERAIMDHESVGMKLPLEMLYEQRDKEKVDSVTVDFRKGKHVVAFLSLTCPHCRIAAKKMKLMKDLNPSLPFYFILNGDKPELNEFMKDTKCDDIPHSFVLGQTFVKLAGVVLPRIYLIKDGILVMKKNHVTLQQNEIEDFLKN